jgi:MFS family permease
MKIDLVGPARRGLAMGLNEAAGYGAVSLAAIAAGYLAATYALRPQPFLLGIAFALAGLLLSLLFVRESQGHARQEAALLAAAAQTPGPGQRAQLSDHTPAPPSFKEIFWLTSWKNRTLFGVSQAGLVNNLNDGLAWGVFPLFFAAGGLSLEQIGLLAGMYPGVWGTMQLLTGALSDRIGRKGMIVGGMMLQGVAIGLLPHARLFSPLAETVWLAAHLEEGDLSMWMPAGEATEPALILHIYVRRKEPWCIRKLRKKRERKRFSGSFAKRDSSTQRWDQQFQIDM